MHRSDDKLAHIVEQACKELGLAPHHAGLREGTMVPNFYGPVDLEGYVVS